MATGRAVLTHHTIIGAVLAGGSSRRFGDDKARIIGPKVLLAMRNAAVDPIVIIGGTPGVLPAPTVADRYPGEGPLGGVATALTYARTGRILVSTCDLPLLDPASVIALVDRARQVAPSVAVVASVNGVAQPSLGCWPATWAGPAHRSLAAGERRFRHLLELGPIETIDVDPTSLADADDRATLESLVGHGDGPVTGADMTDPMPRDA